MEIQNQQEGEMRVVTEGVVKRVVQEMLRAGFIEAEEQSSLYEETKRHQVEVNIALEPLDLWMMVDEMRGVALLKVVEGAEGENGEDSWSHPLVRRQRLTLEQSLMVALLRRHFVVREQERGLGMERVKVAVDDLVEELNIFLGDSGSDQKNERRVLTLLEKLRGHNVVSEVDKNQEITVRPLIVYLADPANLKALLEQYKRVAAESVAE